MQNKRRFLKRGIGLFTLMAFFVMSVMPFPGYAATEWESVAAEEGSVKTRLNDLGEREWMTEGGAARISVGSFNQNFGETWNFQLGGGDLMVNVNGAEKTVWSGTTNILGLFNANGVHFTDTSKIHLTNAGFIGAAMRLTDQSTAMNLKLEGLEGKGYLLNEGDIGGTGNLALLGQAVENRGTIELPANEITIAGGKAMTVGLSGDNLISVVVDDATDAEVKNFEGTALDDQIKNSDNIKGNKIRLDAKGIDGVFEKAINLTGEMKAVDVAEGPNGEMQFLSMDDIYNNAILEAAKIEMNTDGKIENAGTIDAKEFKEHGYTFKNTGTLQGGEVHMDNTDGAASISGNVSSNLNDTGDINLVGNVTLGANVILTADSDANGTGKITFSDGVSLDGNGKNLTLKASGQSIIRSMDDLNDLTLDGMTAGAQFTLRRGIDIGGDLEVGANATLDGTFSVTVRGGSVTGAGDINMTGGTFMIIGNGNFGGSQDWNFNQLIFGDRTTEASTQKTGANKITIAQDWTIKELHTLRGGSSNWDISWGGGALGNIIKVASGYDYSLALSGDGYIYSWGVGGYGQLGNGGYSGRLTPDYVRNSDGSILSGATDIAAGYAHSLAVVGGSVKAWGTNGAGQLGDGTTNNSMSPVDVLGISSGATAVAAGYGHSLAIVNGGVKAWGSNGNGELGNSTTSNSATSTPVDVTGLSSGVTAIEAGNRFSLAIVNGGVKAWGVNSSGELGDGTGIQRTAPVDVVGLTSGVTAISAGNQFSLAIVNGIAKAWGSNYGGALGDGSQIDRLAPVEVLGLSSVSSISAGFGHAVAVTTDGKIKVWGGYTTSPIDVATSLTNIEAVEAGDGFSFVLTGDGSLKGWGVNTFGQLGDGTTLSRVLPVNVVSGVGLDLIRLTDVVKIAAGFSHALALMGNGTIKAWGQNYYGQLGNGSFSSSWTPVTVQGIEDATDIAAGGSHSLAIVNGGVKAWGRNWFGQLGNGLSRSSNSATPVDVIGITSGATAIAAGNQFSLAIVNGGLKAWGENYYGQLGTGSVSRFGPMPMGAPATSTPVNVLGLSSGVTAIAAGSDHALAVVNGAVKAWGRNQFGQLGNGSASEYNATPTTVQGLTGGATAVAAGSAHSLALVSGGLKGWGYNYYGQLGDGSTLSRYSPVDAVGLTSGVLAISTGYDHSLANQNGVIKVWGNQNGVNSTPYTVSALEEVQSIAAGGYGSHVVLSDGTTQAWGSNSNGQLGNNSSQTTFVPVYTGTLVYNPFIVDGEFDPEYSTVSYSGDIVIGGQQVTTQIANVRYNNLELQNRAVDYSLRSVKATEDEIKRITSGILVIHGETRKAPVIDTSNVFQVDPADRMRDILNMLGGGDLGGMRELLKELFSKGKEMKIQDLRLGMNEFAFDPSTMGFDRGIDQFKETVFSANAMSMKQRPPLEVAVKTGTIIKEVSGNARVVAQDGSIYQAEAGAVLKSGDTVLADTGSGIKLSNGDDEVTVQENTALTVSKAEPSVAGEDKPAQSLLQLAFGKVSVVVGQDTGASSFIVQTPTDISGMRG